MTDAQTTETFSLRKPFPTDGMAHSIFFNSHFIRQDLIEQGYSEEDADWFATRYGVTIWFNSTKGFNERNTFFKERK